MANSSLVALCLVMVIIYFPTVHAVGDKVVHLSWLASTPPRCQGSIAECIAEENEFRLDSETNRRILATTQYISYGALQRNTVPCSRRGASYYNCQPGAEANPYTRGCSAITRCRS